jgi:hypothetical protein
MTALPKEIGDETLRTGYVYRWTMFAVTELEQPLCRISKHTALYAEDKRLQGDIGRAEKLSSAKALAATSVAADDHGRGGHSSFKTLALL